MNILKNRLYYMCILKFFINLLKNQPTKAGFLHFPLLYNQIAIYLHYTPFHILCHVVLIVLLLNV